MTADTSIRFDSRPGTSTAQGHLLLANRTLWVSDLIVPAKVGLLPVEYTAPQALIFNIEINLGILPGIPDSDDIDHVLDYRLVRDLIIEACMRQHTQLLETLAGNIVNQIFLFPGVIGIRMKVLKLHIFDDCKVGVSLSLGDID